MIYRNDLNDYNIEFDRCITNEYTKFYKPLTDNIVAIKTYIGLLLNDYFLDEGSIDELVLSVEKEFKTIRRTMLDDDDIDLILDLWDVIDNTIEDMERQSKYEMCSNLFKFKKKLNTIFLFSEQYPKKIIRIDDNNEE